MWQVSDGAAAVLLARRDFAEKAGLPIVAIFRSFQVAGVPPEVMGIGPAYAIPMALKAVRLSSAFLRSIGHSCARPLVQRKSCRCKRSSAFLICRGCLLVHRRACPSATWTCSR